MNDAFLLPHPYRWVFFGFFIALGILLIFLSTYMVVLPFKFAKFYTVGVFMIFSSSFFLTGPVVQIQTMFSPDRFWSTFLYITTVLATLTVAIKLNSLVLTVIMIVIQILASVWWLTSFVPYLQTLLLTFFNTIFSFA